jgi:hypothetical protein
MSLFADTIQSSKSQGYIFVVITRPTSLGLEVSTPKQSITITHFNSRWVANRRIMAANVTKTPNSKKANSQVIYMKKSALNQYDEGISSK